MKHFSFLLLVSAMLIGSCKKKEETDPNANNNTASGPCSPAANSLQYGTNSSTLGNATENQGSFYQLSAFTSGTYPQLVLTLKSKPTATATYNAIGNSTPNAITDVSAALYTAAGQGYTVDNGGKVYITVTGSSISAVICSAASTYMTSSATTTITAKMTKP